MFSRKFLLVHFSLIIRAIFRRIFSVRICWVTISYDLETEMGRFRCLCLVSSNRMSSFALTISSWAPLDIPRTWAKNLDNLSYLNPYSQVPHDSCIYLQAFIYFPGGHHLYLWTKLYVEVINEAIWEWILFISASIFINYYIWTVNFALCSYKW